MSGDIGDGLRVPLLGGCQCGACRYAIGEPPLTVYACHCSECQRQSGGAFGMSMPVRAIAFALTAGTPQRWRRTAASGRAVDCVFCPDCGTRLFHAPLRDPAVVNVKPGTLDDPHWVRPVGHLWTRSARAATIIPTDALVYDQQPASFDALHAAFAAARGG